MEALNPHPHPCYCSAEVWNITRQQSFGASCVNAIGENKWRSSTHTANNNKTQDYIVQALQSSNRISQIGVTNLNVHFMAVNGIFPNYGMVSGMT